MSTSRDGTRDSPKDRRKGGKSSSSSSTMSSSKVQPPDKKKFEREVGDITREIKEEEARLKSLTWTPSQDLATELSKITSELTEAEDKKGSNTSELRRIEDQLRKLGQDGIHMKDDASKLVAGLRYKTEEKIDDTVRKLKQQLHSRQFSATEDRRLQADIDSLTSSKERLREYLALKQEVDRLRNEQDQLRKRRDSIYRQNRDLREHEGDLKDRQSEVKRGIGERREQHKETAAQKDALRKEIDLLYKRRKALYEEFRKEQAAYLEVTREEREAERAAREEEVARRRENRKKRKSQAVEMELLHDPQYEEAKMMCRALLSHLQRPLGSPSSSTSPSPSDNPGASGGNPGSSASASSRGIEVAEKPGQFLKRKTGVEEEVLIPAAAHVHTRRKSKKDRKKGAPSNKRLNYTPTLFSQFTFLGIPPPATHSDVTSTITQLQEMLTLYESKSLSRNTGSEAGDSGVGSTCNGEPLDITDQEDASSDILRLTPKRGSIEKSHSPVPCGLEIPFVPQPTPNPTPTSSSSEIESPHPPSNHPASAIAVKQN